MKKVNRRLLAGMMVTMVGLAAGLATSVTQAADPSTYSSKAALFGARAQTVPPAVAATERAALSTKGWLVARSPARQIEPGPVLAARSDSKRPHRAGPEMKFELAPLK
jgi:hypothetical protein